MPIKEEIPPKELHRHAAELTSLVEMVCASAAFKTSPKSCQFLRYVVENTLSGHVELLKERLIGVMLLGRSASYDTASDAGVRVRANDVRKRLAAFAEQDPLGTDREFLIEVPTGAYVPRFFRTPAAPQLADARLKTQPSPKPIEVSACQQKPTPLPAVALRPYAAPRLSFHWLAGPTVAALFLCTIFMRWQVDEEHPVRAERDVARNAGFADHPFAQPQPVGLAQPQPVGLAQQRPVEFRLPQPARLAQQRPVGFALPKPAGFAQQRPVGLAQPQPARVDAPLENGAAVVGTRLVSPAGGDKPAVLKTAQALPTNP